MPGYHVARGLAVLEPLLARLGDEADEGLRVEPDELRVVTGLGELGGEEVLDLDRDVAEDRRERAGRLTRRRNGGGVAQRVA